MSQMIALCGLNCTQCPMYIATQNDDDDARAEAADMLFQKYGLKFKPEEINCDGCHTKGGRLLGYCNTCKIRECGLKKEFESCAECADQPCDHLARFHSFSSKAKAAFEKVVKTS